MLKSSNGIYDLLKYFGCYEGCMAMTEWDAAVAADNGEAEKPFFSHPFSETHPTELLADS
jgi:hypothetical protein